MQIKDQITEFYRQLPDKKRYVELVTALLTVPVLITVILTNVGNLRKEDSKNTDVADTPAVQQVITRFVTPPTDVDDDPDASSQEDPQVIDKECTPSLGGIDVVTPKENQIFATSQVLIDILEPGDEYCPIVWSYRLDGASFSDYSDKQISLFNVSPGEHELDVRFKSLASNEEKLVSRSFTIEGDVGDDGTQQEATDSSQLL